MTSPLIVAAVEVMQSAASADSVDFHTSDPVIAGIPQRRLRHRAPVDRNGSRVRAAGGGSRHDLLHRAAMFLPVNRAVLLALLFALATSAYSIAGRAVWQHTPSMLLLTIIIYMLLRAERAAVACGWAGLTGRAGLHRAADRFPVRHHLYAVCRGQSSSLPARIFTGCGSRRGGISRATTIPSITRCCRRTIAAISIGF